MAEESKKICGIIMPISAIDGCNEAHWADVRGILCEAIEISGFEGNIVSDADDAGVIHKRIIQNLYDNPVVVCDVSGKNPNVMFELGMRLAFDKPTIIVKDDKTSYTFDTSAIEHLEYPRDLRFSKIVEFKEKLASKIKATFEKSEGDPGYTTFLKHFGEFKVAKLDKKEVSGIEYVISEIANIRRDIKRLDRDRMLSAHPDFLAEIETEVEIQVPCANESKKLISSLVKKTWPGNFTVSDGEDGLVFVFSVASSYDRKKLDSIVSEMTLITGRPVIRLGRFK